MANEKEGMGATITFATSSGMALNIVGVNYDGASVGDINISNQSTTGYEEYIPSTLIEGGTVTIECNTNGRKINELFAAVGILQTITITLAKVLSGDATAPSYAFPGYINSVSHANQKGTQQTHSIKIKVAGDVTVVSGAA